MELSEITCLDDSNKPNEVKSTNWIKKGERYTPVKLYRNPLSGDQYFELEEVQPDPPYGGYNVKRFGISQDQIDELINEKKLELEEVY